MEKKKNIDDPLGSQFLPDWTIHDLFAEDKTIFVIGDSKPSTKFKSSWIQNSPNPHAEEEREWPLRQIASYCKYGETRYGFIITPEELIAVRVFETEPFGKHTSLPRCASLEYRTIPWENSGNQLTVNFSIWALAMMAANDQYREVLWEGQYQSLATWRRIPGRSKLCHHLSGQEMEEKKLKRMLGSKLVIVPAEVDVLVQPNIKRTRSGRRRR